MISKISILMLLSVLVLAACGREPMIELNEENQAIVESKRAELAGESEEARVENEEGGEAPETDSSIEDETTQAQESTVEIALNTQDWTPVEGNPALELTNYLPSMSYQIKDWTNGNQTEATYPMYVDNDNRWMQVERQTSDGSHLDFYNWGSIQVVHLGQASGLNPYLNHYTYSTTELSDYQLVLQSPLQVNASWERTSGVDSTITAIYSEATIGELDFNNLIEVTTPQDSGDLKEYYAEGHGLVAIVQPDETWVVEGNYHENRIIKEIPFYVSQGNDDQSTIEATRATFRWQTNQTYANAFQGVLEELGFIDESITVQLAYVQNDVLHFDFSAGVVAQLNEMEGSEYVTIGALVVGLGEFFEVDQVRITVNTNGMLPREVPYPTNGIYNVSQMRQDLLSTSTSEESTATTTQEPAQTIELDLTYEENTVQ